MPFLHFNFTFKLARILRRWQLGVACLDTSRLATLAEDKPRLNLTKPTEITENGSVTKAVFAANPLGESPLFFVYDIFRFGPYFEVRIFALSFWIWWLYSRHNCYYEKCGSEVKNITEELPFEIPDSWGWTRIQFLAQLGMGQTVLTKDMNENGIPVFSATIDDKPLGYIDMIDNKINLANGDLVIPARGNSIGYVTYVKYPIASCTQTTIYEKFFDKSISQWIYYFYSAFQKSLFKYNGAAIPQITVSMLEKQYIPMPPFSEQQRIIAEIEKFEPLIVEYDKLEQQATKLDSEIYDKLKKSILQYAIQGKLVPQDSNDEPAAVLLERIRTEKKAQLGKKYVESYIFKGDDNCYYEKVGSETKNITDEIPFDIPDSWSWARIDEIFQHNTGKALNSSNTKGSLKNYITTSNLYWGYFKLDSLKQMLFTDEEVEKCSIRQGDLLVCEGGDIGRAAIWNYDFPMCIQNHIHRLRAFSYVEIQFYYYVFYLYKQLGIIGGKGIGIQGLSTKALGRIILPVPPLNEQRRILNKISIISDNIKGEV